MKKPADWPAVPAGCQNYVLIDDGDGRASEKLAKRLAGRGIGRVFVLAGVVAYAGGAEVKSGQPGRACQRAD